MHLRRTPLDPGEGDALPSRLARESPGYTGADIAAVCQEAAMAALEEAVGTAQHAAQAAAATLSRGAGGGEGVRGEGIGLAVDSLCVCWRHFTLALVRVPPSAPPSGQLLAMYERFHRQGQGP